MNNSFQEVMFFPAMRPEDQKTTMEALAAEHQAEEVNKEANK